MAHWAMQAAPERTAKAVPALIHSLNDEDPRVRVDVVNALAKIGPRASEATDALQEMLDDEDEQVRAAAVRALEAVGNSSKTREDEPVNSVP